MMSSFRQSIESHFGAVLLVACGLGLVVPGVSLLPDESAVFILAALMFVSCFRLSDGGCHTVKWPVLAVFLVLRYGVLPWVLWLVAGMLAPQFAVGAFLLAALPAGVSSAAISSIYGGVVAPGFAIIILSQLLVPFLIPLQFSWLAGVGAQVDAVSMPAPMDLFITMVWCIFLPMLAYYFLKGQKRLGDAMRREGKLLSMLLVAMVIALVVAKQREMLLAQGLHLLVALAATLVCFFSFMVVGWWVARGQDARVRITYAGCSCFNNAALGVSLALLHFPPEIVLFVAVSEMAWSMLPMLFGFFLRRVKAPTA